jgi:transcriptional regulator with XRE-family HTH domain
MESVMAVFGRRLRSLRKSRGLTQEELGRAVQLDYKHIGRLERGEHGASFEAVQRFAQVLGVQPFELFLPERLAADHLDAALASIAHCEELDPGLVKEFVRDLLVAARRLQSGRSGQR